MNIFNVLFTNDRCTITVDRCLLLIVCIFSCAPQGQSNGSPIPTTLPSNQDGEPPTSPSQNGGPSMYSRYWISYVSVLLPKSTGDNQGNSPIHDSWDSSPDQSSNRRESISSPDPESDRRQSISSHDQRLSPPFDYDEMITHSAHSPMANMGSPSSSDSDPRIRSSADNDPRISSWRPISLHDQKDRDRESPMILFDEHGVMHRNYYTSSMGHDNKNR